MVCSRCHHRNASGWKYCIACGARLNKSLNKKATHSHVAHQLKSKKKSDKTIGFSKKGIFLLNSILIILIALATLTIFNIYGNQLGKTFLNHFDVRKNYDGSDWSRFEVKEGNYSVLTPNEPKMQKIYKSISQLNEPLTFYDYTDAIDSENIIAFAYAEYPSDLSVSNTNDIFDSLANETLIQNNSQIVGGGDEEFLGYPSIEFSGRSLDEDNVWYVKYLFFIKENHIYMLSYKDRTQEFRGFNTLKNSFKFNE